MYRGCLQFERDGQVARLQHRHEQRLRVETTLLSGANDARERLLRVRPVPGAIAAPHFARDDGRPDRLFGPPIGRIDRRIKQEGPQRGKFAIEMGREALHVGHLARPAEPFSQARDQMTACDREPVRRDDTSVVAIADRKALLQEGLHVGGEIGRASCRERVYVLV